MPLPTSFIPEPDPPAKRIIRTPEVPKIDDAEVPKIDDAEVPVAEPILEVIEDIVVQTESMEKRYTLKELRVMCVERNLSDKGNKSDLVERLGAA